MIPQQRETFGASHDQRIHLADAHTRTVQAWLASRSPLAVRIPGNGISIASTGLQVPLLNLALGFNFPAAAADADIAAEIQAVRGFFKERGTPWLWWIGPTASPANVEEYLQQQGIAAPGKLPAMIAPPAAPPTPPVIDPAIQVWRAGTLQDLAAASQIRHRAFRFPPGEARHYFEEMAPDWLADDSPARLFLAGERPDAPAAIGAVIMGAGVPGIYLMATAPDHTRRGLGKALLAHLLRHIRSAHRASPMIVLTASRYGFPLYAQFGFQHLFDYAIYTP